MVFTMPTHWHKAFDTHGQAVRKIRFAERFLRLWRNYLAYWEAGFRTGRIDLMQVALTSTDRATGFPSNPQACLSPAPEPRQPPRTVDHPRR